MTEEQLLRYTYEVLFVTETMQGPRDAGTVRSSRTGPPSCYLTLRAANPGSPLESHCPRRHSVLRAVVLPGSPQDLVDEA